MSVELAQAEIATLPAAVELLEHIESMPATATGVLSFGDDGVILLQNRRICWAVAANMHKRLTDILCQQKNPPLPRTAMEDLFRQCKEGGKPIGEALVSSGLLSEGQLRRALSAHTGEAVGRIARARRRPTGFLPHTKTGYDARFVFQAVELLASVAASQQPEVAASAHERLQQTLVAGATGFAFSRHEQLGIPMVLAVDPACELRVAEALEIGSWSTRLFDVTTFFEPGTSVASATWCSNTAIVTWRDSRVSYAAVCSSRPASTLLLSQLAKRARTHDSSTNAQVRS
ncbi:MAG: hypothetical protein QM778_15180 [Myxococcales bacterium]